MSSTLRSELELSQFDDGIHLQAGFIWNSEKCEQYASAATEILYNLTLCIDTFDYEYIQQCSHTKTKWYELKKYFGTSPMEAREDMSKLTGFKPEKDMTIEQGWVSGFEEESGHSNP